MKPSEGDHWNGYNILIRYFIQFNPLVPRMHKTKIWQFNSKLTLNGLICNWNI